ncbi:TPA: hypothetical protein HA242_04650 [Candidatus Woesearchaeota archaeon]|nr:hypothetical protein [Candidatus Woesearchaeota archaeon]HIH12988.1 hypothetical protein [Candidatus Woesearchaeota archaeon]
MTEQDQILSFLRMTGPTLPSKVAKSIKTEILFASAHLSDLASQKKVKISNLKIGGSPLYYLPGQEAQLYNFAAGNLNPKDFQVLELLKEQKILREADLDLLPRVALRGLKDFAIPIQVNVGGQAELFWKFHLLSEEETNRQLDALLNPSPEQLPLEAPPAPLSPEPPLVAHNDRQQTFATAPGVEKSDLPLKKPRPRKAETTIDFLHDIERFFKKMDIALDQKETLRKNAELNFLIRIPSLVGETMYFCKAKNKQRCDEKDLAAAYMEAQVKKMPLLFLYTNELNKKAQEMLESGAFANVIVKKIG